MSMVSGKIKAPVVCYAYYIQLLGDVTVSTETSLDKAATV